MADLRRSLPVALLALLALLVLAPTAAAVHNEDRHSVNMANLFNSPNGSGTVNSDLAFWGSRAYAGDYGGFRIFNISNPASPSQLVNFRCWGPQNDPVVWDNRLLFLAVDRTLPGPECSPTQPNPLPAHDDPNGWEGVRIFDVSNPAEPRFIKGVYTDCGAHTITLYPKNPAQPAALRVLVPAAAGSDVRRGPRAREWQQPASREDLRDPGPRQQSSAGEGDRPAADLLPGRSDNKFDPDEHALPGFGDLTACHDIGVFVELQLAAAACAEQAQLWRIKPNGIPDTENPLWVYDDNTDTDGPGGGDSAVDFWHSGTFSSDGRVVNFIDESFGIGCPPVTPGVGDTGRMFFLRTRTGRKLSDFTLPRTESALDPQGGETAYCSAHLGNAVRASDRDLLVNAWYMGGVDVIDFTDPRNPREVAYYDAGPFGPLGSDNWSAYWYEGPSLPGPGRSLTIYGTDGVHNPATGRGLQVFRAGLRAEEEPVDRLNPQTQERLIGRGQVEVRASRLKQRQRGARPRARGAATLESQAKKRALNRLAP